MFSIFESLDGRTSGSRTQREPILSLNSVASIAGTKEAKDLAKVVKADIFEIGDAAGRKDGAKCIKSGFVSSSNSKNNRSVMGLMKQYEIDQTSCP